MNDKLVLVGLLLMWMPINIRSIKSLKEMIVSRRNTGSAGRKAGA